MTHEKDLLEHPPTMAEMAGTALEFESHHLPEHMDVVPPGLAALEAETEA